MGLNHKQAGISSAAIMLAVLTLCMAPASARTAGQQRISENRHEMKHGEGFIVKKGIDGNYTVIFHIMRAPEGMRHSKDHYHLMVTIEKDGKSLTNLRVNSKVKHPGGTVEKRAMLRMGDWFLARYNLDHEQGRHWIVVTFKTTDGKKHSSGTYYPER